MAVDTIYFGQVDIITKNIALKFMILVEAFRMYIKQQSWSKLMELLNLLNMDSNIRPYLRRGIYNQIVKELAIHGRTKTAPREVVEALTTSFHRPFTNEALLFLLDHVKLTTTILRLFHEDHGILPHISVSNKAFLKEMETLENCRKWRKKGNKPRTDPAYYITRRKKYRQFTKHFDTDRVNAESIRLLFKYAVDRDEVKRIWNIAIQAAERDPTILRKNQHFYLGALRCFPIQFEDIGNDEQELEPSSIVYQNAENLAELYGVLHTLKEHGQQPNRETLITLMTVSAMYGSSNTLNILLPKLMKSHWTPTPREFRDILRMIPQEFSTDLISQHHKIQGNPKVWIRHRQKLMLSNYLRQFVGNSEACLVEYVRALGRCGATNEVWEEWSRLRERGFRMVDGGNAVKDGTLAAFVATLGVAGDAILVKRCFAELKAFKMTPMFQTPVLLAGLLACRPTSFNSGFGQEHSYPLFEAVEGMIGKSGVMETVQRRMRSGRLNRHWSWLEKRMAKVVFDEADILIRRVKSGEDITWAGNAVIELLEKVSRDGSVPGGSVSVAVKWDRPVKDVRL
ncbi:hypothetical protein L211DRAFT_300588 [Terfezia boudieri ATCC MYA-4762]|uniref:Uncharacterized protein n=1 Tax=Terfezia boudieri ATCC MYA-4762 TaxID=1051890 RepID=A0A3N4LYN3_9PEZI|nr:hypothetical protein L211DRAFT_300588 [Terfezia boudieri ATCC MYA-4762]